MTLGLSLLSEKTSPNIDFSEIKKLYLKASIFSSNSFSLSSHTTGRFAKGTALASGSDAGLFPKAFLEGPSFGFFEATYSAKIREIGMK